VFHDTFGLVRESSRTPRVVVALPDKEFLLKRRKLAACAAVAVTACVGALQGLSVGAAPVAVRSVAPETQFDAAGSLGTSAYSDWNGMAAYRIKKALQEASIIGAVQAGPR